MTFAVRQINLQFSTADGETTSLEGLRCSAIITNPGGSSAFGQLRLKVYGMTLNEMNKFSSTGANQIYLENKSVTLSAGDEGTPLTQVFSGQIISSYIDLSSMPDISFNCAAISGWVAKGTSAASNHYPNGTVAEKLIESLTAQLGAGWRFQNYNKSAHCILTDQYVYGSLIDQIQTIARAAQFPLVIENNTVTIWDNKGVRDNVIIEVSPETGLVGYPSYWEAGFTVKSEFKPTIINGRQVKLTSSLPKANGTFPVQNCTHEISTLTPDGPWFTTSQLSSPPYVAKN